ncbi:MAG TPA: protein kinase, partial [Anaerolineae bacterium]|nr:protein kinase [Anaerolineae bacterium]
SVTHGNLSASRIFLGLEDHVWIAGFGQTQALFGVNLMKQGYTVSSPETMAPERVHGQGPSRQSDLYALGILCYQMLAGKPPFTGSPSAILHAQAYQQPRPLYRLNPGIPVALSEVVGRMLSKGLELRYNTGAEFARALAVACTLPKSFPTHGFQLPDQRSGLFSMRWLGHASTVALVLLAVAGTLIWAGYQLGISQQADFVKAVPRPVTSQSTVSPQNNADLPEAREVEAEPDAVSLVVTATPTVARMSVSDTLPTATYTPIGQRDSLPPPPPPTATRTPIPQAALPVAQPAAVIPAPAIPAGQSLLIFYNPTGHDLVVDLTGPTGTSKLVPPNSREEFLLTPGRYQCMVHTPTGQFLASRVLEFEVFEGQALEKDYYTDYDTQSTGLANN